MKKHYHVSDHAPGGVRTEIGVAYEAVKAREIARTYADQLIAQGFLLSGSHKGGAVHGGALLYIYDRHMILLIPCGKPYFGECYRMIEQIEQEERNSQ